MLKCVVQFLALVGVAMTMVLVLSSRVTLAQEVAATQKTPQIVILRFDDVRNAKSPAFHPEQGEASKENPSVPMRWQRLLDYLEKNRMKGGFGVIGESLEKDDPDYFRWIKETAKRGNVDFWLHGYKDRNANDKPEFEQPYEQQYQAIARTQALAREKLGAPFTMFAPHWSRTNADTDKALDQFPEITMYFGGVPSTPKRFGFGPGWRLEFPTHNPDFAKFKAGYEKDYQDKASLYIFCGHPLSWDDQRWSNFVQAMEYLRGRGCLFVTPSEFVKMKDQAASK